MHPFIALTRLDKPIGIWLTFFPAAWVLALQDAALWHYVLFLFGAAVMRSAGCIINDLTDRDFDPLVARTKARPLAAGTVPVRQAYLLLLILLLIGLLIVLALPFQALPLALCTVPLIVIYPWMKRITWWPQLFLGITFNMGALFASIATSGHITHTSIFIYAASILWTLGYDTLYALQDKDDDALIGVKSTARRLGRYVPHFAAACYVLMGGLFWLAGVTPAAVYVVWAHGAWQVMLTFKGADGGRIFRSNQWLGLAVLFAIFAAIANI